MREIKFRALSMCKGEHWLYGDIRHYAHNPHTEKWTIHDPAIGIETDIDETTIGQFTGLKDKNDKEIYEGDIIYSEFPDGSKTNCLLGWDEENSCFGLMDEYNYRSKLEGYDFPKFENAIFYNFRKHSKKFEVIGNIYDNPDLLKDNGEESI